MWVALIQESFRVMFLTRLREQVWLHPVPGVNHLLRVLTRVLYGIDIGNGAVFGSGVNFTHIVGIVIGPESVIGARVQFMGSNTIGVPPGATAVGVPASIR